MWGEPLNFFPTPQQQKDMRGMQFRPLPANPVAGFGSGQSMLDADGKPIVISEQQAYFHVQVVKVNINPTTSDFGDIQDDAGNYWVRLLTPWLLSSDDDDDASNAPQALMLLDAYGQELVEGQYALGMLWGTGAPYGHPLLKLVLPGNTVPALIEVTGPLEPTEASNYFDMLEPLVDGDQQCIWKGQVLRLVKNGGQNECGHILYPSETEGPTICYVLDTNQYQGTPETHSNPRLLQKGERGLGVFVAFIPDPENPTHGARVPLYAIKTDYNRVFRGFWNPARTHVHLVFHDDNVGYYVGKTVNAQQIIKARVGSETFGSDVDLEYFVYCNDTGSFECMSVVNPIFSAQLTRTMLVDGEYQCEWRYMTRALTAPHTFLADYGGFIPVDPQFVQTQFADGMTQPDVYELTIITGGNTGPRAPGGSFIVDSGTPVIVPFGTSSGSISVTHFTVTGSGVPSDPYLFTGVDNSPHGLTFTSNLTPQTSSGPAFYDNMDVKRSMPVNVKLQLALSGTLPDTNESDGCAVIMPTTECPVT